MKSPPTPTSLRSRRSKPLAFARLPKTYAGLISLFSLRPLQSKADLRRATAITDALAGHPLNPDQDDYFSVLATLINQFELTHLPQPRRHHDPVGNLVYLLEEHRLSASDLGRILGHRELGPKILLGHRELSKSHILKLAAHFKVTPALFI
jgi:HTH-type transcriptional regulator / antitoxin HigA